VQARQRADVVRVRVRHQDAPDLLQAGAQLPRDLRRGGLQSGVDQRQPVRVLDEIRAAQPQTGEPVQAGQNLLHACLRNSD